MAGAPKGHARYGGRKAGTPNKQTAELRTATQKFFHKIVSDEREEKLWKDFIEGKQPNVVNWQAFKRAVEYKRGMPVQPHSGEGGGPIRVQIISNLKFPDPHA